MACEDIENELAQLRAERREQKQVMQYLQGAGLSAAQERLEAIEAEIARTQAELEKCREQGEPVKKLSISVASIHCNKTTKEIDRDEPYVFVTSVNLAQIPPVVDTFKYGPWADVKKGEDRTTLVRPPQMDDATWNLVSMGKVIAVPFWGIDGKSKVINDEQDVIFVVSIVEHDASSDADALRGLVKSLAFASVTASIGLDYSSRVDKLVADVKSALEVPTGFPNFEDPIGTKALPLLTADLTGTAGTMRDKKLTGFTGQKANYTVTCRITYG